ncbi:putative methyltransferase, ubiE/COQ5 family [Cupriavidus taiwanensis]|uniref:class I SAM-dependent methyltransferase n=1 Tax=Cupriavidus taiwanensis TaxID=164546 RepID=UPI000E1552E4|nr:class I SAM-dependent methyltransferase [Cupriavidus taiwanensis]SPA36810.1 putative methyltransferase, ubiE/COQ5 family [Cupriavidus taiwanensis]
MGMQQQDKVFAGAIAEVYEALMVPMIFAPYAADLGRRIAALRPHRVLELAAGTGALTRELAERLPADTLVVATDLNAPMLARAQAAGTARPVQWREADAMQLPFDDASFDLVACQFGAMFFPNKGRAFAEARRMLVPGGTLVFNVWDRIAFNAFARDITAALATLFPEAPPDFMVRIPHGYHSQAAVEQDLRSGGFTAGAVFETVTETSHAATARIAATAFCQGTPLRTELEARGPDALARATEHCERALVRAYGNGPLAGPMQAHVVMVAAP